MWSWSTDEARRPGIKRGMARRAADHAVDRIRDRFGWDAIWAPRLPSPTSFKNSPKEAVTVTSTSCVPGKFGGHLRLEPVSLS
jgi:hypothetical protein